MPRKKYKSVGVKGLKNVKPDRAPRNRLKPKSLRTAQKNRKRSGIELKMYEWLKEEKIDFAKEKSIGKCHADIFIEPNIVIEVQGCYYHKCRTCHPPKTREDQLVIKRDMARFAFFRSQGYVIHEIWEHEVLKHPEATRMKIKDIYKGRKK